MTAIPIDSAVIEAARLAGIGVVARTPITESAALSERYGDEIIVFEEGLGLVPGLIRRNETKAGRRLILFVRISDRPGGLARLLTLFAETGANLVEVEHVREGVSLHVRETGVQAVLEVRGRDHADEVLAAVRNAGYEADEVEAG